MIAPERTRLRPTVGFALLTALSTATLAIAWAGTPTVALVFAGGVALVASAPLLAWRQVRGVRLALPQEATCVAGRPERLALDCAVAAGRARDLLVVVGDGRRGGPVAYLPTLDAGAPARHEVPVRFAERGRAEALDVRVRSTFPFGLVEAEAHFRVPLELCVLPRIGRLGPLERHLRELAAAGEPTRRRSRDEGEFHALREWRAGESLRGVAWRPSARRGRLLARELSGGSETGLRVVLCTTAQGTPRVGRRHPSFERAVSLAASVVEHGTREGRRVRLELCGAEVRALGEARARTDLVGLLRPLADVRPEEGDPSAAVRTAAEGAPGWVTVVVLAGSGLVAAPRGAVLLDVDDESGEAAWSTARPLPVAAGGGR